MVGCAPSAPVAQSANQEPSWAKNFPPAASVPQTIEEKRLIEAKGAFEGCRGRFPISGGEPDPISSDTGTVVRESKSGRLPAEEIQKVVRHEFKHFRACYEPRLNLNASLEGRVVTRFVIGRDGHVTDASIADNTIPDCYVASCMAPAFEKLRFPAPDGGIVTVTYPIMFSPG